MHISKEQNREKLTTSLNADGSETTPVGAAMVVGGGISGMQASLDLADQGFKVFLVENQSAIGGKMAQLDKTFPTNDCAMCTISPKLVETGRHINIEILTNSEVVEARGEAGNFNVLVRQKPRYIDPSKCVACGDCVAACPVQTPDRYNETLVNRHAIFKLYPQAVPNSFAIEKKGIAPCRDACPAGQRAQGYIALIREGRWDDAMRVIKMDNPFPGICGRICNHRCETACNRDLVDEPINIRALKRFVTDKVYSQPRQPLDPIPSQFDQSIAIIGAGPCGLTAAKDLVLAGYPVTVFEAMPVAGGMLRLGVPEYRLPTQIIEREVQDILDLGVELRLNSRVDNLDDLFSAGYEAVLIAVGAHEGIRLRIPGADLDGVLVNTHFLRDVRLNKFSAGEKNGLGEQVLVLGGGNVAIDCARTVVRLGRKAEMACLEGRHEMPAHDWEVAAAEAEGVVVHGGRSFERILGDANGRVVGIECMEVTSFSFDETGRLNVEKRPDSLHVIPCDTIIFSVGQRAGLAFIPDDAGVGITNRQTIAINPNTLAATRPGVFAAGDSVSGTAFVIEAVDSGHRAAESIIRYLLNPEGQIVEPPAKPELPVVHLTKEEIHQRIEAGEIHRHPRVPLPELPVELRINNFAEVEGGYDDASAQAEAARCLACGVCSECMSCTFVCGRDAIIHDDVEKQTRFQVGAMILAPGFQIYQSQHAHEFGLGRYPNVVSALQFERLLSASGPTMGHLKRPSDGRTPKKIAFLQCIGSRDQNHDYCSSVCCMYATKQATIAKEHDPDLEIHIFMMDMRAFSKGYMAYFERAQERYHIQFTRCRVSSLQQDPHTQNLTLHYLSDHDANSDGNHLKSSQLAEFDMVVLSVGMEISSEVKELCRRLDVQLDHYGFAEKNALADPLHPLQTNRAGIYAVGPLREPKDIPESVVEASGAAACVAALLSPARFSQTTTPEYPPERDVAEEEPRVGVFVCHCGSNIGGYLDVANVTEYAASLPFVTHSEANLYTCSQDSIRHISQVIQEQNLNRVVVASCTPITHKPLFQDSLRMAGLNPYLFEMANIRNQCSWVHSHDRPAATDKARRLVQMAVAHTARLQPQHTFQVPVQQTALVVGGGPAGMTAALSLAEQGFSVNLVEKTGQLGGNLRKVYTPALEIDALPTDNANDPFIQKNWRDLQQVMEQMITQVVHHYQITVYLNAQVISTSGFKGNFTSQIAHANGRRDTIQHGVSILATGAQEQRTNAYGYGCDNHTVTLQEFEQLFSDNPELFETTGAQKALAMILCVQPEQRQPSKGEFCSRICCSVALKNAIAIKQRTPHMPVVIFYKDIRSYGFKERLYTQARQAGVIFIRFDDQHLPQIIRDEEGNLQSILAWDLILEKSITIPADWLVLAMPIRPSQGTEEISSLFKAPLDADGFFQEAHVKLRPVDFATEGLFVAGMAHYPKLLDETIIHAQAAAARAGRVLSQATIAAGGRIAVVDPAKCTGCLTCVRICPFHAPHIIPNLAGVGNILGAANIEAAVCQGCGTCAAECPARAIQLVHYTDEQMEAKIQALVGISSSFIPIELIQSVRNIDHHPETIQHSIVAD
jgi:heterodisulfide reductase subunit A-like polyferredoxin